MKVNYADKEFNIKLSDETINRIEPDPFTENRFFVFLPVRQLCKLHKFVAVYGIILPGDDEVNLPAERESLLEFDNDFTNITLSVNGSSSDVFYKEEIFEIEFTQKEKNQICALLKTVA